MIHRQYRYAHIHVHMYKHANKRTVKIDIQILNVYMYTRAYICTVKTDILYICVYIHVLYIHIRTSQYICVYIHVLYIHIRTSLHSKYQYARTEWRRLRGCLEFQVIFRKRATNYKVLWRKMTYEDKAPYDSTPPCIRSR